ncbi:MAG: response regulator [Candidatus Omnitrophota bacterium]
MDRKIKVTIVDDEADFRSMMSFWLKSKGYDVSEAPDGETAIRLIKEDTPDILFLDLRMPVMNGMETLRHIRQFNKELPVIVISAYVNDPGTEDILNYGISGVFYKGKNFEDVLTLLESALRTHKNLKKKAPRPETDGAA